MDITLDGVEVVGTDDTVAHDCPALCLHLLCCLSKLLTSFPKFSNVVLVLSFGLTVSACHMCTKAFEGWWRLFCALKV